MEEDSVARRIQFLAVVYRTDYKHLISELLELIILRDLKMLSNYSHRATVLFEVVGLVNLQYSKHY